MISFLAPANLSGGILGVRGEHFELGEFHRAPALMSSPSSWCPALLQECTCAQEGSQGKAVAGRRRSRAGQDGKGAGLVMKRPKFKCSSAWTRW